LNHTNTMKSLSTMTQNIKDLFCRFKRHIVFVTKVLKKCCPYLIFHLSPVSVKSCCPSFPILSSFLYIGVFRYSWKRSHPEYTWNICTQTKTYWMFMKLYTVVVHILQMCMKEYRCCLKFGRGDNSTYTFTKKPYSFMHICR
jgi:hypothetical protein